jgi:uncharacterized protein
MVIAPHPFASRPPAWWIPGPHAQTLWGKFARRTQLPRTGRTERWDTADGDFVDVFRVPSLRGAGAPRLLVLHGLEGTIHSHYARGILARAAAAGWAANLLIFRGCGGILNRLPRFYHSGETGDLAFVVDRLIQEDADAPLALIGYSLGGNVLLKWLGEEGGSVPAPVRAAAAVSVPYDLEAGARYIHQSFSRVYEQHFLRTLKAKALTKAQRFPESFDVMAIRRAKTIVDFDDVVTAPLHGFAGARDYYRRSSALQFLRRIEIPTRLISAYDDPFLPALVLRETADAVRQNPHLVPRFSEHGGHVGFVGGAIPGRPVYFAEDDVMLFLASYLESGPREDCDRG